MANTQTKCRMASPLDPIDLDASYCTSEDVKKVCSDDSSTCHHAIAQPSASDPEAIAASIRIAELVSDWPRQEIVFLARPYVRPAFHGTHSEAQGPANLPIDMCTGIRHIA